MATHSSVLAWRIPGTGEPGGLPSMGSHWVGHDWSDLAAAAAVLLQWTFYTLLLVMCMHFCGACIQNWHCEVMLCLCSSPVRYWQFLKLTVPIFTTPAMHVSPVLHILEFVPDILVYVQKYSWWNLTFLDDWWGWALVHVIICHLDFSFAKFQFSCPFYDELSVFFLF